MLYEFNSLQTNTINWTWYITLRSTILELCGYQELDRIRSSLVFLNSNHTMPISSLTWFWNEQSLLPLELLVSRFLSPATQPAWFVYPHFLAVSRSRKNIRISTWTTQTINIKITYPSCLLHDDCPRVTLYSLAWPLFTKQIVSSKKWGPKVLLRRVKSPTYWLRLDPHCMEREIQSPNPKAIGTLTHR